MNMIHRFGLVRALGCPRILLAGIGVAMLLSGCASPQMKGTPFYTGEYEERRGPAEDRIAMWPLLYYRDPALSVLWPLVEKTDDHFAIRPVMSVYGLDKDASIYNVLWPIARFDMQSDDHRIFPVFWGDDYAVAFPLYWHFDDPFGGERGYDALLPIWSYRKMRDGHSTHFIWPIFHHLERNRRSGFRVWPLVGHYESTVDAYDFFLWPLGHRWQRANDQGKRNSSGGSTLLPLYYHEYTPYSDRLFTLLYSHGRDTNSATDWDMLFPLFFSSRSTDELAFATLLGGYHRKGDSREWLALPLLSGGRSAPDSGKVWVGGPLAHWRREKDERESHVFPFYYRSQSANQSLFVSLPWSQGQDADGDSWQLVPPLMYREKSGDSETLITPLYSAGTRDGGESEWDALLPLYFRKRTPGRNLFASLLGGYETREDGRSWLLYPLLSGGHIEKDEGDVWVAAPFIHAGWSPAGSSHHVLPLYYWNSVNHTFVSPLAARWGDEQRRVTAVPALLSLLETEPKRSDLWTAGGLAHLSWGEERGSQYVFPLFYDNPDTGTFLSPLWARWASGGGDCTLVPPLLSGWWSDDDSTDVWAAAGLFHNNFTDKAVNRRGHLLPLYLYEGNESFYTLLFGWDRDPHEGFYYPVTPLVGVRTGNYSGGWFFPFFSRKTNRATGRCSGSILWGDYWREDDRAQSSLFPFFHYRNHGLLPDGDVTSAGRATYGTEFSTLLLAGGKDLTRVIPDPKRTAVDGKPLLSRRVEKQRRFFPLFKYSRRDVFGQPDSTVDASVLLLLWDYHRKAEVKAGVCDDYTRSRLLWRVWHYERLNGDVSVDAFPFMTYDSKTDGFRKLSFMWRFFRYERGDEGTKLDLLFVPLAR